MTKVFHSFFFIHRSSIEVIIIPFLTFLRIHRIYKSGMNYIQSITGEAIDNDEKVKKLTPGTRLEIIFL
jgi:hypothetical protein